jgi:Na+-transporting NADH:ubiquinone oxidoreductase subunit NqrC
MKRTLNILSTLSLACVLTAAALGHATSAPQAKPEHLSKQQLITLIAEARTPAEHQRIAQYFQAKAQDYLAQANEHEQMVAAYKANPSLTAKSQASTINHCEYFVQRFKDLAAKSQELAQLHEQMAEEAE